MSEFQQPSGDASKGQGEAQLIRVDSVDDPRLVDFRNLKSRPVGRVTGEDHFVVEGQLIVQRLLQSDFRLRGVVADLGRDLSTIGPLPVGVPVYLLSRSQIEQLAGFHFHRGFLASAYRKPVRGLEHFTPDAISLSLVQITDMQNLGSMLRSAAAFGIRQVLIDGATVDPYSRRAMRVSMGAALGMEYVALEDPARDLRRLQDRGVESFAATLAPDSVPIGEVVLAEKPVTILVGNEAHGLPQEVQRAAGQRVTIPIGETGGGGTLVDSLNVSVAAAILMHELASRRRGFLRG